jgi:hypothetical protein
VQQVIERTSGREVFAEGLLATIRLPGGVGAATSASIVGRKKAVGSAR